MAKMRMPKEQYDQLYFCLTEKESRAARQTGRPPRTFARRRYETIDEVRKAALAKSKAELKAYIETINSPWPQFAEDHNSSIDVYKGDRYLGFVTHEPRSMGLPWAGVYSPAEHPKDETPLNADGSIYRGKGTVLVRRK